MCIRDRGPDVSNYATSSINNSRVPPAVNSYAMSAEGQTFTVTQEQVDAGQPLVLEFGTREAGLYIDRIVLSSNTLTESDFNALPNSDTDAIPGIPKAICSAIHTNAVSYID